MDLRPWPEMVERVPPLSRHQRAMLAENIAEYGIQVPIIALPDGRIIDGTHRWQIAHELGIDAPVTVLDIEPASALVLGMALNIARRQLSPEQEPELVRQLTAERAAVREAALALRRHHLMTQEQVAQLFGVAQQTIDKWEEDGESNTTSSITFPPDLRVSVPRAHYEVIAERATRGESHAQIAADYGITRQRVGQIVALVQARRAHAPVPAIPLPSRRYRCLVIDPPWPVAKIEREARPRQGNTLDYPVMSIDDIAALPVPDLAEEDGCHLYLWVTHRFLPDGLELIKRWGFQYKCLMTWVKNVGMTPFSWMYSTEHVVFARRGSLSLSRLGLRLDFAAKVTRHSAKPDIFYERVMAASPAPRLELFARRPRDGFDVWGNEVTSEAGSDDELEG